VVLNIKIKDKMVEQEKAQDRIRVLHVLDKFSIDGRSIHGVARLMAWWAKVVNRERFEMNILGLTGPNEAGQYIEEQGGRVFYSDIGRLNPATIYEVVKIARRTEADILHLHGYRACTFGRIAGALLGIPAILHEHVVLPSVPVYQKAADWLLAPLSDRTVVNCEAVATFCVEQRSMDPEEVDVIFNGIPLDEFRNVSQDAAERAAEEIGIDPEVPIVGTVARLDEQKGVTYLIKAIPSIKAEVPNVKVLVVGHGTLRNDLEEEARHLGVSDSVIFTGERRDVPRLYKLMDVKVISSLYEGTTLTVFEAMAAGTPLVATTVDGVREVLEHESTGLLFPPKDATSLADAVTSLLVNSDKAQRLARRAKQAVEEYDVRNTMRRIESLYETVFSKRSDNALPEQVAQD
jgi:glycosyltransferase involved in cell wall biosynthesis